MRRTFRIVEIRPNVFIVERKILFFWVSLKKWAVAQTFGSSPKEFRTKDDAIKAIDSFCTKKEKPMYPRVIQQHRRKCDD